MTEHEARLTIFSLGFLPGYFKICFLGAILEWW